MKHLPRKRFGQHFLTDQAVIAAIVQAIAPQPGQSMVEIGPGLAALTQPLVERLGRLCVIELDRDLAQRLQRHERLDVIAADALTIDFTQLAQTLRTQQADPPQHGHCARAPMWNTVTHRASAPSSPARSAYDDGRRRRHSRWI